MGTEAYKTLAGAGESFFEDRRSLFYGFAFQVETEKDAFAAITSVKSRFPDARHHVYAFSLREGNCTRYSDDREPQGSAGLPVLDVLRRGGIVDACIVVVRYFGGTLLGTGGLVHAYGTSASEAVRDAGLVMRRPCCKFSAVMSYSDYQRWQQMIVELEVTVEDTVWGTDVEIRGYLPAEALPTLAENICNTTAGRALFEPGEICFASVSI